MKKPALLRAAITALFPDYARDPDKLALWVETGQVRAGCNGQRGFALEYQLTLVAEDFTHAPEALFFAVVDWLRSQQPDVTQPNAPGFAFEVDVLDERTFDVKMVLPLREIVTAAAAGDGAWHLDVLDDAPLFPEADPRRSGAGPTTALWTRATGAAPVQVAPVPGAAAP
ncbi:MAG: phage tail protein [Novosphingobium meiothermophilum]